MELWNRARSFAEEAAKRSNDLSLGASKLSNIITETTKEIAAQASKHLPQPSLINDVDPQRFGITEELRDFVKGITITTFEHFPLQGNFFSFFILSSKKQINYRNKEITEALLCLLMAWQDPNLCHILK